MRKLRRVGSGEDDPLMGVANFFDLGVILALAFMVPLIARMAASASSRADAPDTARKVPLEHFQASDEPLGGEGERLGMAYRLKTGQVVYVPDSSAPKHAPNLEPTH